MHAVAAAQFTAVGTIDFLVDQFKLLWGCPTTFIPDNGLQFTLKLSNAIYERLDIHKINTSTTPVLIVASSTSTTP